MLPVVHAHYIRCTPEKRRYSDHQYHVAALAEAPKFPNPNHYRLDPESSVRVA